MSARIQQIITMLELQNGMNTKVNADWQQQGFEWYRAIWVECAELLDHYGWKWWKKQSPDVEQVKLELIDIWHFGLSILLQSGSKPELIAAQIQHDLVIESTGADFRVDLERFAAATLADQQFHIGLFAKLMAGIDLSFDALYSGYVGKNVLNFFRQDNGYKDGSYRKHWFDGREDNEHLVDVVQSLDASAVDFKDQLYATLLERYKK